MKNDYLILAKNTLIYGLGRSSGDLAKFLLLPLYTRYLTPIDYGIISLIALLTGFLNIIFSIGTQTSVFRFYSDDSNPYSKGEVFYSSLTLIFFWCIVMFGLIFLFKDNISILLFDVKIYSKHIILGVCSSILISFYSIPMFILRSEGKPQRFVINNIFKLFLGLVFGIIYVVIFKKGALGVLEASLLTSIVFAIYTLFYQIKKSEFGIDISLFLKFFKFGFPLVFAGIGMVFLNSSDKLFLRKFSSLGELGVYSIGYTLGSGINMFIGAFQNAWPQFIFSYKNSDDAGIFFGRVFKYYIAVMGVLWLTISMFSEELVMLMTNKTFWGSYKVIPIISMAYIIYGACAITSAGIYTKDKTYNDYFITPIAAICCIVFNYIFIKRFGMIGAAWATLLSFFILFTIYTIIGSKYIKIVYEKKKIGLLLFLLAFGYGISLVPLEISIVTSVIIKITLLFLILLIFTKSEFFFNKEYYYLKHKILN